MSDAPEQPRDTPSRPPEAIGKSTKAGRLYVAVVAALLLLLLVVLFIGQNGDDVKVNFLWLHGHMALGLALLLAAVIGGLLTVLIGTARILQLRTRAHRHEQGHKGR